MMESIEKLSKSVVFKLFEHLENKDQSFSKLFTNDAIFLSAYEKKLGINDLIADFICKSSVFSDIHYRINQVITEGNTVVIDYNWTGTQKAEYLGVASRGNHVDVRYTDTFLVEYGQIKKWRCLFNWASMKKQMIK